MSNFFSTVGQIFFYVAQHPDSRVRDIAQHMNVTDRTVILALGSLSRAGLVKIERQGRRNTYTVLPHGEVQAGTRTMRVSELLLLLDK